MAAQLNMQTTWLRRELNGTLLSNVNQV